MNNLEKIYQRYLKLNQNICTDTRSKKIQNSLFFCIKGENFDGNLFIQEALDKKASYIITEHDHYDDPRVITVKDTIKTLQDLAKKHRQKIKVPIIGITGTNGKTTTKILIDELLSSQLKSHSTKGNFNNHIGVPLTILSIKKDHEIAVVELGANHLGEIQFLCSIAKPTHGIITNIGKAHLEGFKTFENIIKTKGELYQFLKKNNGVIFFDKTNPLLNKLINTYYNIIPYTTQNNKFNCTPFITFVWKRNTIKTKIIGDYNINNIITAITVAKYFKIDDANIISKLEEIEFLNNRSQFIKTKHNKIILDAYNANPTSVKLAIKNFLDLEVESHVKRIIILGDMMELGDETKKYHQEIVDYIDSGKIEKCILVGTLFKNVNCSTKFSQTKSLIECETFLKKTTIKNTIILIKGSRKMQLETLIDIL